MTSIPSLLNDTAKEDDEEDRAMKRQRTILAGNGLLSKVRNEPSCIQADSSTETNDEDDRKPAASSSSAQAPPSFHNLTTPTRNGGSVELNESIPNESRKRPRSHPELPVDNDAAQLNNALLGEELNAEQVEKISSALFRIHSHQRQRFAASSIAGVVPQLDTIVEQDPFVANLTAGMTPPPAQLRQGQHHEEDSTSIPSGDGAVIHPPSIMSEPPRQPNTFGRHFDTALHVAIRDNNIDAAIGMLQQGAPVHVTNAKRVTPLILAAQKGSSQLVRELLARGASPLDVSMAGSSAMLQAAHFGQLAVVKILVEHGGLVELANYKSTTALMRAAQEGHALVVQYLIENGALVNRRNNEHMSALMLAAQRGHGHVCQLLLDHEAEVDAMTMQKSTSLMLACKREHLEVVKILITAGCELMIKDCRGRTARDWAKQRRRQTNKTRELLLLLDPQTQFTLMREKSRVQRNFQMVQIWTLLQQERATCNNGMTIHEVTWESPLFTNMTKSETNLIRTMTLPAPMVELIASYMPLPSMWAVRLGLITRQTSVDPDTAVASSLNLIDEVLEEGGFMEACDTAKVVPPSHFSSWSEWKAHCNRYKGASPEPEQEGRPNSLQATLPGLPRLDQLSSGKSTGSAIDQRRGMCFLLLLAHRLPSLQSLLLSSPYSMPKWLIQQLVTVSDIQSLSSRLGPKGVKFEAHVAMEMVMLASSVCSWFEKERDV